MRVLLTGGSGFLGQHVQAELKKRGHEVLAPTHDDLELLWPEETAHYLLEHEPFDCVIHLAALCGGIGINQKSPADFFYTNVIMGTELLHLCCRSEQVGKFVSTGTVCSYPKHTPVPFKEADIWNGYPEETNAPYGLAKKMLLVQSQAYRDQYGFNAIHLIPVNLYGPGDNFDPHSSHVIPAIIRKVQEAIDLRRNTVQLWGTGRASREFLYVKDAAEAIVQATEKYDGREPVNLGTGLEIRIKELAWMIRDLMGYEGSFQWDADKPDGQPHRRLDVSRAKKEFGWAAKTDLVQGLQATIEWWRASAKAD